MRDPAGNALNPIWVLDSGSANVKIPPNNNGNVGKNLQPLSDQVLTEYSTFSGQLIIGSDNEIHRLQISNNDGTLEAGQGYKIRYDNLAITFVEGLSVQSNNSIELSLSPNPVNNVLNVNASHILDSIEVFNLLGQNVRSKKLNSNKSVLSLNGLKSGIYIAKIKSSLGDKTMKFVKE